MNKVLKFLVLLISLASTNEALSQTPITPGKRGAWTKPNVSYGEIRERISVGKVLLFPTACGAPDSLYATDLGQAALYFDSCGATLYKFNPKVHAWSEVGGAGSTLPYNGDTSFYLAGDSTLHEFVELKVHDTCCGVSHISNDTLFVVSGSDATDTTSLSNRIDLKLNASDTAVMLNPYLRKIDTASLSNRINLKLNVNDTAVMLSPYLRSNVAAATYRTQSQVRSDISLTTTGSSGAATYDNTTGVLNVPAYSSGATGAAGGDLSGTYPNPTVAKLNGQLPAYYLDRANHSGSQTASTISDFTTATQTIGDARYPVLSGSYSNPSWITGLAWGKITSTPTTLSGYGITDAAPISFKTSLDGLTGLIKGTAGTYSAITDNSTNWNTAFSWGNHASAGYATATSTTTFTNKSGNNSQWTNDAGYLTTVSKDATLTGLGTSGTPLGINLANSNTWTGAPIFSSVPVTISGNQSAASWTTNGIGLSIPAATYNNTTSSGTVSASAIHSFGIPTNTATSTTTYTNSANVYIAGAPVAGTNVTQSSAYALYVAGGISSFQGGISTSAATSNGNFGANSASASTTNSSSTLVFGGASSINYRAVFNGQTATTGAINASIGNVILGNVPITEAASGTHAVTANLVVRPPVITNGTATTTDATSVYIEGAPTGTATVTNTKTALWVASGVTRLDGGVTVTGTTTIAGPVATTGSTPSIAAGTGAGTSPTVSVTGNDASGYVTITTGTTPTASGNIATVTFSAAITNTPKSILLTAATATAATDIAKVYVDQSTASTTAWIIKNTSSALTASTTYKFYYQVFQ